MKFKKSVIALTTLATLLSMSPNAFAADTSTNQSVENCKNIRFQIGNNDVVVNNKYKSPLEVSPLIKSGNTLVPLRFISENLDAKITWNGDKQQIIIEQTNKTMILTVGSTVAYVNGSVKSLEVAPEIINGNTMVPVRFVSETFDTTVKWEPNSMVVDILSNKCEVVGKITLDMNTFDSKLSDQLDKVKLISLLSTNLTEGQKQSVLNRKLTDTEVRNIDVNSWSTEEANLIPSLVLTKQEVADMLKVYDVKSFRSDLSVLETVLTNTSSISSKLDYSVFKSNSSDNVMDTKLLSEYVNSNKALPVKNSFDSNKDSMTFKLSYVNNRYFASTTDGRQLPDSLAQQLGEKFKPSPTIPLYIKMFPIDVELLYQSKTLTNDMLFPSQVRGLSGYGLKYQNKSSGNLTNILLPVEKGQAGSFLISENGVVIYTGTDAIVNGSTPIHTSYVDTGNLKFDYTAEQKLESFVKDSNLMKGLFNIK
jgi:hypothetical protein